MLQNWEATIERWMPWGRRPNSGRKSRTMGWRPAAKQAEHPSEGNGVVEVAPDSEQSALEGLDPRQLTPPEPKPGRRVGRQRDIGPAPGGAFPHPRDVVGAANLPGVAEVAEL